MKMKVLWLATVFVLTVAAAQPGCRGPKKEEETEAPAPKKEKPGAAEEKAQTKVVWTCGMAGHPEFDEANTPADGKCPQCGMKLVKKEIPVAQPAETYWTCPMHPDVREKGPGNCPTCGMKLVKKEVPVEKTD